MIPTIRDGPAATGEGNTRRRYEGKEHQEASLNLSLAHVAAALDALNDSHTFFLPPSRPNHHDYGFQMQMIGDQGFVVRVRPGSDAEAKGVKPGDEILALEGIHPIRQVLWKAASLQATSRSPIESDARSPYPRWRNPERATFIRAR